MPNYQSGGSFLPAGDVNFTGAVNFAQEPTSTGVLPVTLTGSSTIVITETGTGKIRTTTAVLTALPMTISQAHVGGGTKIFTFPEGIIAVLAARATVTPTTTSAILTTLNGTKTLSVGVGSVLTATQDSGTLITTEQDIVNAFSATSSTTINTPGVAGSGYISATTLIRYDGHTTPQAVYLNCGVPTASDIDGDATTTWSGTVVVTWLYGGDF